MKSKLLAIFVTLLLFFLGYLIFKNKLTKKDTTKPGNLSYTKAVVFINNNKLSVEIADTEDKRERGLSGRQILPENEGMLFSYDTQDVNAIYWMKDMLIPIDIIWLNDSKVVSVSENLPPPELDTPDDKLTKYPSLVPVDYVLEVNSGFVKRNNIKVGDSVDLTNLNK